MTSKIASQNKQVGKGSHAQNFMYHRHIGGWLPQDHQIVHKWVNRHIEAIKQRKKNGALKLADVVQRFKDCIEGDPHIYMGFHEMFTQVPESYRPLPVDNYIDMLELFDDILHTAPEYEDNELIGFPINAILDWPMGTEAGYRMFTTEKVNLMFKELFDEWVEFLKSSDSCYVLDDKNETQWFWPANVFPNFVDDYECAPGTDHWGFTSWDNFFTRTFKEGRRDPPPDDPTVVLSACESTPYRIAFDVQRFDQFWLKGQPYSVQHMLHCSETDVQPFIGGTVYQAFLSARDYHRWHSPVNGVVTGIKHVSGTYYAESREARTPEGGLDPAGPDLSQAFITNLATRVIIWIKADPPVGEMCFVAVGMAEVSSCAVNENVVVGAPLTKGQEIGMFHYGGSTHCLVFNKDVDVKFTMKIEEDLDDQKLVQLNTKIATVSQKTQ